jgi:hypothetical protein
MKLECWEERDLLGRTACSPFLLIPVRNSYLYEENEKKAYIVPTTISAFSPVYRRMNAKENAKEGKISTTSCTHAHMYVDLEIFLENAPTTISFTPNSRPFNTWPWRSVNINSEEYIKDA